MERARRRSMSRGASRQRCRAALLGVLAASAVWPAGGVAWRSHQMTYPAWSFATAGKFVDFEVTPDPSCAKQAPNASGVGGEGLLGVRAL